LQTSKSSDNSVRFHRPGKGDVSCGYEGIGRLWPVDVIVAKALEYKKRWRTARAPAQKKIGGEINLLLFHQTTDLNYFSVLLLDGAFFFTGEAAFFATFLAGAFLAGAFIAGAGFLAAGLAEAFFAAGISYPPFHSAVAEDKKLSFQFAWLTNIR
jgi:hypothetical protein